MARKKQDIEILEAKIRVVIWMLKKGKTKKACCEHLGIPYNTKKLDTIIEDFKKAEEKAIRLKEKMKKTPLSKEMISNIISEYQEGDAQSKIAERYYISAARVKKVLLENNVPIRSRSKKQPAKVDHITQDLNVQFKKGDKVFIPKYNTFGVIKEVYNEEYIEHMSDGFPKAIDLGSMSSAGVDKELVEGIHYESYWIFNNDVDKNISWKTKALQHHLAGIENSLAEYGSETYKLWIEENNNGVGGFFSTMRRESLYPIVQ